MNAFELVESELEGLEAATKPLTVRFVRALLERVSFKLEQDNAKLAMANSFRPVEVAQIKALNLDPNSKHHDTRYDEHEQLDL